jgi:hypothetical protein
MGGGMKHSKYFDLSISGILIPLWVVLVVKPVQNVTWLNLVIIIITSLIILAIFARAVYEVIIGTGFCYKCQCRRIDAIVKKTRKKMQRLISGANNPVVMNHAIEKMRESYRPDVCSAVLGELAEKERDTGKKENLRLHINQIGGLK